jgi:drug/metabolite transporter (DMT)-like permease
MTQPKLNSSGLMAAMFATATWGMVGIFIRWLPGWSPFAVLAGRFFVATAGVVTLYTVLFNTFTDRGIAPKSINIVFMTCLLGGVLSLLCAIFFTKLSLETGIDQQLYYSYIFVTEHLCVANNYPVQIGFANCRT